MAVDRTNVIAGGLLALAFGTLFTILIASSVKGQDVAPSPQVEASCPVGKGLAENLKTVAESGLGIQITQFEGDKLSRWSALAETAFGPPPIDYAPTAVVLAIHPESDVVLLAFVVDGCIKDVFRVPLTSIGPLLQAMKQRTQGPLSPGPAAGRASA